MSFSPELVVTLLGYVRDVVKFVEAVKDAPREMKELNDRMRFLAMYLSSLETTLQHRRHQLKQFTPDQHAMLVEIMNALGGDVRAVNGLYEDWRGNKGPWGLEFRFSLPAKFWHELGPRKEEMASLGESIDKRRKDLSDYLLLLGFQGMTELTDLVSQKTAKGRLTPEPTRSSPFQPAPPAHAGFNSDYKIIFVDPYNEGRSVVAEAMARMMREWTKQAGATWRVSTIHSAGFHARHQGDIESIIADKLIVPKGTTALPWRNGGNHPNSFAVNAMFDPSMCRPRVRSKIQPEVSNRRSRGVRKTIFQQYDYIVVFHSREYNNLLALKRALVSKEGQKIAPEGKGRIVHIGAPTLSGTIMNVLDVDWNTPENMKARRWQSKVAEIRGLTQDFLIRRVGWQVPEVAAK
ncbi:hypothetical protein LIA77_04371 [Sarocladium implicatum]|nr:hypothetical protein LIA77_04371 [Sarocladium implicatum]